MSSEPVPLTIVLAGALADPRWTGEAAFASAASETHWTRLVGRTRVDAEEPVSRLAPVALAHEAFIVRTCGLGEGETLAAHSAFVDGVTPPCWRIDPVHLHVGRDHLVLTDADALADEDARALAAALAPLLDDEGLQLTVPTSTRWYLHARDASRALALTAKSRLAATGRNIDAYLPQGEDARRWRRLVNEVEMTWFAHPVNERRAQAGLPPVNSLWLAGRVHVPAQRGTHDALRIDWLDDEPMPAEYAGLAAAAPTAGHFALSDRLLRARLADDPHRWHEARGPLLERAGDLLNSAGAGATLVLTGETGWRRLRPQAGVRWRFWQRVDARALLVDDIGPAE